MRCYPYVNNPRHNTDTAIEKVAISIKEFGFRNPIIVDKDNTIVCGHTRYQAAKRLNLEKIPIIKIDDLTPTQIRAYRIADNKASEYSKWDNELLSIELEMLQDLDYDLEFTSLEEWEYESLLNPVSDEDLQDFFVEKEPKEKEPKKIKCPLCNGEFEQ